MEPIKNAIPSLTTTPPKLPTHQLGKHGLQTTALGFGAIGLSAFYITPKLDSERFAVLDAAYEAAKHSRFQRRKLTNSCNQSSGATADVYGDNEDLLGAWFRRNPSARSHILLATKFGNRHFPDGSMTVTSSASYCREACEASLARLDTPSIELYYCHRLNKSTPVEETVQAIAQLQKDGKIRHLGLSECSAESLRRACAIASIAAVQVEYSPITLDTESPHIALLDYSPIGCGMITGQMRSRNDFQANDFRKMMPCSSAEKFTKNLQLVDENKGCTATQLTLAWLSLRCGEPDSSPSRFAAMTVS